MGERRRRREQFFREHPQCCFCGGDAPASTVDHVPNRAAFRERLAPEGFEFPACVPCQNDTRLDEIAFAFMVHFLAEEGDEPDEAAAAKLKQGLKNNLPHLWNFKQLTTREKRKAAHDMELRLPPGFIADAPLVGIGPEWFDHIERYLAKLARALFYKHVGRPAPADWVPWTMWTYERIQLNRSAIQTWVEMTPFVTVGQRTNTDLGERFIYRANMSEEIDAFVAVGKFGGGMIFYCTLLAPDLAKRTVPDDPAANLR